MIKRQILLLGAVCVAAALAAVPGLVSSASSAEPLLCAHECGGSWGAYEHAKVYGEEASSERPVTVESCKEVNPGAKRGETQWNCWGIYKSFGPLHFEVNIGPYGSKIGNVRLYELS